MTQNDQVLQYMQEHPQGISSKDAWLMGIGRLAARIRNLRDKGYTISSELVRYKNKEGKSIAYAVYKLEENK